MMNENEIIQSAMMSLLGEKLIRDKIEMINACISEKVDDLIADNKSEILKEIKL